MHRESEDMYHSFSRLYDGLEAEAEFFSPGRVNVIGEHLDYNGGYVFPAAISLGISALVRYRDDSRVRMRSFGFEGETGFSLKEEISFDGGNMWGNYPRGVMKYLLAEGYELRGCDILFSSTLPGGSGLSSSAAMEVLAGYIMIYESVKDESHRVKLALLCQKVENEFIGVKCGIMDQFAVAMGRAGFTMLLNAGTMEYRYVPLRLEEHALVIMNSNKPRALADSKYNERRGECTTALEQIGRKRRISTLAEATMEDVELLSDDTVRRRARHVVTENARVLESVKLLGENRVEDFGRLLTDSHVSLQKDYEVTGRELDALVYGALESRGCIGARMTGAGFGGCAVALVRKTDVDGFISEAGRAYTGATGLEAGFYETRISDGVMKVR